MERKLDEIKEMLIRQGMAQDYRDRWIHWQLEVITARLSNHESAGPSGAWLKIPLALALPVAIFLLMLSITGGDIRAALRAAKLAG